MRLPRRSRPPSLSAWRLCLFSVTAGLLVAAALYHQAWRFPVVQNLRDARLFFALTMIATPILTLLAAAARLAAWICAVRSAVVFLIVAAPAYALVGSFQTVQTASRDKAVICNVRQLIAAADQYFLENGTTVVPGIDRLVGPQCYIKSLKQIAGEDYAANFPFHQGGVMSAEYPDGRILSYNTGTPPADYKNIFEPSDPRPSWRPRRPAAFSSNATPPHAAAADVVPGPALTDHDLAQAAGPQAHVSPRGTMCARCHARKN